jgi:hypothetical protein
MGANFPESGLGEFIMKRNKVFLAVSSAALAAMLGAANAQATTITQWAFTATAGAPDNSPAPTTGSGTAVSLGMTNDYTYTNGEGPGSTTDDDITTPGSTSEVGWRIRGNSNTKNAGAGMANGWNNAAPNYTQGAEFEVNTAGYNNLNVSFDWFATTQGAGNLQVLYTLDANNASPTWVPLGGDIIANPNNWYGASTPMLNASIPVAGGANFAVEMVSVKPVPGDSDYSASGPGGDGNYAAASADGFGGAKATPTDLNDNSGNWSFNNITITGTAVPEPASISLLGLPAMSLLARRRAAKAK